MYDALTYVMGRTYLSSPTRARARTMRLIAQPYVLFCLLCFTPPYRATTVFACAPVVSPHCFDVPRTCECMIRRDLHAIYCRHTLVLVR